MLPIGNRPIVDYVVQDCLAAGITEIIFVIDEHSTQLKSYYSANDRLEEMLKQKGKDGLLTTVAAPHDVTMRYVVQPDGGRYGTAVPVGLASRYIGENESALVLMGDDFIWNPDGSSETARLISQTPDGTCSLLAAEIDPSQVSKYGVIAYDDAGNYREIVEKPQPEYAPSNLINISKYVLTKSVIELCNHVEVSSRGEYELTAAINTFVENGGDMKVVRSQGEYLDGGSVEDWLHANRVVLDM